MARTMILRAEDDRRTGPFDCCSGQALALGQEKIGELLQHGLVDRALPGTIGLEQFARRRPAPGVELLVVRGEVDVGVCGR